MKNPNDNCWYENWFNSRWYHMLYRNRDMSEAERFISTLLKHLSLPKNSVVLDLACGKGRHSLALNRAGYDVTGIDLSEESIREAKLGENAGLHFEVHDMRKVYRADHFDAVFNLFTSFGYFEQDADDQAVIDAVHAELKNEGVFVLDFLNAGKVRKQVSENPSGEMVVENSRISWRKNVVAKRVEKKITVNENGQVHHFMEQVRLYSPEELKKMLEGKFAVLNIFGDYSLNAFDVSSSDRLIIIAKKI